jgi:RNA polymerase sigma-B factor
METFAAGKAGAVTGLPATRTLAARPDADLLDIVRSRPASDPLRAAACEILVTRHHALVRSCVRRYLRSPEPAEDLLQVGYVGLLKAINNFDPGYGGSLAAYAQPCISGEIKRHFRDKRWQVRVERPLQELVLEVREATRELSQAHGATPGDTDLAAALHRTPADIRAARQADLVFTPASLDAPLGGDPASGATLADTLGAPDPALDHATNLHALATHWNELPAREQKILLLRYYGDLTQAQIGARLGISQMHVSRLLAHALTYLRTKLTTDTPTPTAA